MPQIKSQIKKKDLICHFRIKRKIYLSLKTKVLNTFSFIFLQQIKRELLDSQQKVSSLQELSAQLLVIANPQTLLLQSQASEQVRAQGSECLEAQEKVHVIMNRLRLLLREVSSDLEGLEKRLEAMDKRQVRK